jgi:PAS domain S-box-containing protein
MQYRQDTCRNLALATSLLSIALGVLALAGWWFRIPVLTSVFPGLATMKPITAATFLSTGVALWLLLPSSRYTVRRAALARVLTVTGMLIGLATLMEYGFNVELGLDSFLFPSALTSINVSHPGRMSESTALAFLLLNSSLLFRNFIGRGQRILAEGLALSTVVVGFVALLGYIYNVQVLYGVSAYSSMAVQTATLFVLLGLGTLLTRPDADIVSVIISDQNGGAAARRLLPVVILAPVIIGWLRLRAQNAGWFGTEFGVAVVVASSVIIFATVVWINAKWLNRSEDARARVEEHYRKLAAIVESSDDAIIGKDDTGIVTSWNFGAERIFGYTAAEMVGQSILRILPDDRQSEENDILRRIKLGETVDHIQTIRKKKNGQFINVSLTISPIRNASGKVVGASKIARDISDRKRTEEALQDSEGRLRVFVEHAPVALAMFDREMRYLCASRRWLADYGLGDRNLGGLSHYEIFPEIPDSWKTAHRRGLAGEVVREEGDLFHRADGSEQWLRWEIHPWHDAKGGTGGIIVFTEDITERRQAEEHLRQLNRVSTVLSDINQTIVREKDSRAMLEAACRIAVDKGQFRMAWIGMFNAATQELSPTASSGVVDGYLDLTRIDLQNPTQTNGPAARCLLSGEHTICNDIEHDPLYLPWRDEALHRGYRSSAAFPLRCEDKIIGVFNLYASELAFFDDDETQLLDQMALDISFALEVNRHEEDRRKGEEELRWRTAFFEAQVESALDGIMVVDHHGKIILQNQRVFDLWKIPAEISDSADDSKQVQFVVSATKNPDHFVQKIEYLYSHPDEVSQDEIELLDGTILDRYSSPVKDKAGTYYGRIWVFHDITKRRHLEEQFRQSQKMEAIGQLTGGIAHDFNNLLGVIVGNLDLIERRVSEDTVVIRRVQTAQKAAERGADLTRRLLAFSSNVELKPSPTDLHRCVRNMIELSRAVGPDLRFTTHFDDSMPPVLVDAAGFENALLNLVVNARDAMPNGGAITISTQLTRLEENYPPVQAGELKAGRYACVSVSDTGSGMSKEILDRVFEPFFTTKPRGKGTGLGLAMVYGFVKQSGGSVRIYSEPGVGTTVTFYLLLAGDVAQSAPATDRIPSPGTQGGKVLVVDDELDLLDIATAYLDEMGYTACRAEDGPSALAIVEQNRDIDLVITDIIMPGGMNGVQLAQKLRQLLPQVKIIYSSGFPASTLAERSMPLLDGPLLRKPYQRADFETAIHMALE